MTDSTNVTGPAGPAGNRRRRADARANHTALLDAAARVLLRDGYAVPLDRIAHEAGVGVGTLYRNFSDRDELITAVVDRSYKLVAELARAAAESPAEPLDALAGFFAGVVDQRDRLVLPMMGGPAVTGRINPHSFEISTALQSVIQRGISAGTIRADVGAPDVMVAGAMLGQPQLPPEAWRVASRRIAAVLLDGLRARPDQRELPLSFTREEFSAALTAPEDRSARSRTARRSVSGR
ncbi:AcrR family transcriptional regulator [Pseudonocardia eucalypti]|nr:AcrR family transcriptional regulator [Pseudonocardia eucalypti]